MTTIRLFQFAVPVSFPPRPLHSALPSCLHPFPTLDDGGGTHTMMQMQMDNFQFAFDPLLFPEPPSVPPSSELFSASETSNLIGFLDNFTDWDLSTDVAAFDANTVQNLSSPSIFHPDGIDTRQHMQAHSQHGDAFMGGAFPEHMLPPPPPPPETSSSPSFSSEMLSSRAHPYVRSHRDRSSSTASQASQRSRKPSSSSTSTTPTLPNSSSISSSRTIRPLLDDKQKRMNHIMSEQKRRNAIRDGYAQLTALLAPAGAPPGTGMPTRGRPKGSGIKGKSRPGAGKSGVLLRAVEYCRWLNDSCEALRKEIERLEAASGIRVDL